MNTAETLKSLLRKDRVPLAAKIIDTLIALTLIGFGIYHFTQPNQAWRSGTTEIVFAAALLAAAYLVPRLIAAFFNGMAAIATLSLGIRHIIHGAGYTSGSLELIFTAILITATVLTLRKNSQSSE